MDFDRRSDADKSYVVQVFRAAAYGPPGRRLSLAFRFLARWGPRGREWAATACRVPRFHRRSSKTLVNQPSRVSAWQALVTMDKCAGTCKNCSAACGASCETPGPKNVLK